MAHPAIKPPPEAIEIINLRAALVTIRNAYGAAQSRYDRAHSNEAKQANIDAMDRWNRADRAICAAIHVIDSFEKVNR